MNRVSSTKQGFTMVELLMVLAVAGLVFLMVILAIPALQRSARDADRREDFSFLTTKLKDYQTNHRGALPDASTASSWQAYRWDSSANASQEWNVFYRDYLEGENFVDPDGTQYALVVGSCGSGATGQACPIPNSLVLAGLGTINSPSTAEFPNGHAIFIIIGAKCSGESAIRTSNIRKVAVLYKLENGGAYCGST